VAEAKFQSQTAKYTELIRRGDVEGIMDALTDRAVELKVPMHCCRVIIRILE
jgi:chorismate mutase